MCFASLTSCCLSFFPSEGIDKDFTLNDFGFIIFHSPYCKLVQKSVARLLLNDFLNDQTSTKENGIYNGLEAFRYEKAKLKPLL